MGTEPATYCASLGTCSVFYTLGIGFGPPAVVVLHRGSAGAAEEEAECTWLFCSVHYCEGSRLLRI